MLLDRVTTKSTFDNSTKNNVIKHIKRNLNVPKWTMSGKVGVLLSLKPKLTVEIMSITSMYV